LTDGQRPVRSQTPFSGVEKFLAHWTQYFSFSVIILLSVLCETPVAKQTLFYVYTSTALISSFPFHVNNCMRIEVLTAIKMSLWVFWVVTPHGLVSR
jgi:hypothetical protein